MAAHPSPPTTHLAALKVRVNLDIAQCIDRCPYDLPGGVKSMMLPAPWRKIAWRPYTALRFGVDMQLTAPRARHKAVVH